MSHIGTRKGKFLVIAHYYGKTSQGNNILTYLHQLSQESRQEPGNVSYEFYRSCTNTDNFVIIEIYKDEKGFFHHRQTVQFKNIVLNKIIPLLERREIISTDLIN